MHGLQGQPPLDLIVTMDDATSAIYSAFLVEEEGTASTFRALMEVFGRARPAAEPLHRSRQPLLSHGRRLAARSIARHRPRSAGRWRIWASSISRPIRRRRAAGRSVSFQTLQDRLPKELALGRDHHIGAANAFLRDVYLPAHNARFAVKPSRKAALSSPMPGVDLGEILCVQEERQVGNDNCVSFNRLKLQIPESPLRPHFVKARVKVHVNTPTAPTPSSTGRAASAATTKGGATVDKPMRRLNPLGGRACGRLDKPTACPPAHRRTKPEEADI